MSPGALGGVAARNLVSLAATRRVKSGVISMRFSSERLLRFPVSGERIVGVFSMWVVTGVVTVEEELDDWLSRNETGVITGDGGLSSPLSSTWLRYMSEPERRISPRADVSSSQLASTGLWLGRSVRGSCSVANESRAGTTTTISDPARRCVTVAGRCFSFFWFCAASLRIEMGVASCPRCVFTCRRSCGRSKKRCTLLSAHRSLLGPSNVLTKTLKISRRSLATASRSEMVTKRFFSGNGGSEWPGYFFTKWWYSDRKSE